MEIQTMMRGLWVDDVRNPPQFIYKNKNVKWVQVRSVRLNIEAAIILTVMIEKGDNYERKLQTKRLGS